MDIKAKGTVTIPGRPRSIPALLSWASMVNRSLQQLRDRSWSVTGSGSGRSSGASLCNFGSIVNLEEEGKGIKGGIIYCGNKTFNAEPYELALETPGVWLVSLQLECESNRDDDNEIFLPEIATSSETDAATFWDLKPWSTGTNYDDNENPDVSDGIGDIVVPLGKLTIADGAAIFEPVACGNVTISQCAGILSHSRG